MADTKKPGPGEGARGVPKDADKPAHAEQAWADQAKQSSALRQAHDYSPDDAPVDRYDIVNANLHFGSTGPLLNMAASSDAEGGIVTRSGVSERSDAPAPAAETVDAPPLRHAEVVETEDSGDTSNRSAAAYSAHTDTAPENTTAPEISTRIGAGAPDPTSEATQNEGPAIAGPTETTVDEDGSSTTSTPDKSTDTEPTTETPVIETPPVDDDGTNEAPTDIVVDGGSVEENSEGGTLVAVLTAEDPDAGDSFTFEIVGGDADLFEIVGNKIYVRDGADIDFETATVHDLTIRVTDSDGNSYTETISIDVENVFGEIIGTPDADTLEGTSEEDVFRGRGDDDTMLGSEGADTLYGEGGSDTIDYGDSDEGVSVNLATGSGSGGDADGDRYSSIENVTGSAFDDSLSGDSAENALAGGKGDDRLDGRGGDDVLTGGAGDDVIDGGAGTDTAVYSGEMSDYAIVRNPDGSFVIADIRGGTPDGTDTVSNVENFQFADGTFDADELVNEAPTDIIMTGGAVDENAGAGSVVATLDTTDPDAGDSHSYAITDDPSGAFEIVGNQIVVKAGADLDFETAASHDVTVEVTDSGGNTYSETFTIDVTDVNESTVGAISDSDGAADVVAEDAAVGDTVGVTAFASDTDVTDTVTYSLSDDAGGLFAIDANTGVVTVAGGLDAETATSHDITIVATSSDGSTSTETLTINVSDVDEFDVGSVTDGDATADTIAENAGAGTATGIVATASDGDVDDTVSYSVDDARFEIDASGNVTVASGASFDAEAEGSIDITVTATSSDGSTSLQTFSLSVSDVNESAVGAISDSDGSANTVAEDASVGDTVGVTALAADADATDTVTYSLSDDAGGLFAIDANTGVVTVAGGLDAETATSHDITVVATSSDGSTSTETLTINVSDVDEFDVGSVTDSDATADTIAENAGAGTATGIVATASDGDVDDTVSYSVDDARFEIDASGNVTVASGASFDAETEGSIDLTVTATSSDGSTSQQTFSLSVSDVNEFAVGAISDSDGSANTVAEDASVGDTVGVTALAADADATDTVTYSLSDDAGGLFAIDANTGVVTVAGGLDAETATSHDITVVATSSDGSTSTETLTINVSDVDEFDVGSVTDGDATADTIAENAGAGTATGIVASASDADVDDTVSYSVDDARFEIDASGNVTVASGASFDAETEGSIDITVTATSSDGSTSQQTFSLNVSDVDEFNVGSISDSDAGANTVAEDASVGDTVGVTASATDADADDSVTYSLSDDAGGLFAIDANTGVVTVAGGLDAETATSHDITVVATSSDGSTSTETLTINVSDVDEFDVGSVTDSDATADTIAENAGAGTATGIVATASDGDVDDTVSYSVDDARFEIDASGNVTVASGASFDAEAEGSIDITVTATSSDGSTSLQTFSLSVSDVNESAVGAISDSDGSANTVAEDASVGDTVGVTALAADADATDTVTYSLSDDAGGLFAIDANTGVVTVAGGLDAETATSHDITVVATSSDGSTSTETLTINVSDVDEFDVGSVTDSDATADTIAENAGAGTATGIVATASDGDVDDTVSYSVDDARFEIDASGNVTVASGASFDAETEGSIDLTVTATSSDGSTSQQTFSLSVSDVNESAVGAISDSDGSANTVAEDASVGDTVGVTALAADADATDTVTYSLSDDAGGLFAIDANTGVVTVAGGLDAETATSHDITVVATSSDGSTSTETLTINVSDVDEFDVGSVTDGDATADTIAENAGAGTATGIVASASDADVDDTVSYSVDDARFEIDASGNVTVASGASFDAETEGSIDITVTATSSDGSTSQQTFSLNVSDVDEFNVGSISDSDAGANTVAEDASVGDTVGVTASATDADADDSVTYSLSDDAGGLFAIDANTGVVTVAGGLDAETATSHDITVVATSSDGSTSTETLTINVSDVDEFDVGSVTDSDATADTIAENAGAGTATGIVATASDGDVDDTVSYSVDDARFEIDASGNVTVASGASFDAETEGSIDITVTATSSDGSTSQQTFSLDVSDVDEFDVGAISDSDGSANTVAEDASVGDTVGVTALAADADATDTVTYSLSDDAGGLFAIDANTGVVTVAGGLDAETATSHDITVVATSSDGSTSTETLTINVSDVDEFDVGSVTDSDATADTIAENAGAGTATGIVATASDGDVDDTVSYSVDDARFEIDASGNVTVASGASFDAETEGSIDITVTATSSDGSTSQQTFSLSVSDVNESAVGAISDSDGSANTVAEDASVGDTVGVTALASDADADDTVTYSLSDDAGGLFAIDANTGVVTVAGGLDAETATSHDITIVATSSDGSTSTETLTINVSDVDEFDVGSITDSDATADTIAENAGAGTATGIVATASDGDVDDTVSYSVDDARFEIDASGNVTVASGASFDAETEGSIDITVTATSSDGSTSQQTFSLSVSDVNESAVGAISDSDGSANTVAEDASVGDTVGVTALAADADATDTVTYSLSDDAGGLFAIDANTGVVTVAGGLDAETATSHDITVVATSSDGSTSTETLTINVSDVDEFDVGSVTDGDATADTIAENAGAGTATGIVATASDGDVDDTVSYSVDDARFEIDASGNVTVASGASFDAETEGSIDITVTATSSDGSTSQQTFSLNVSDVDEFDVGSISDSDGSANTVAENASVGDTVGVTASATDADADDSVTYSLSDDAGGLFAIDANTGVVTVAGGLDAETATSHDITVVATSSDGSTSTETLTINVSDVDEFDVGSVTDSDATADTIAENAGAGTATGIVATASDGDVDDTVSYSVDDARFEIDASGNVTVASGASFDAETEGSIDITVTATSSDGSTSQQTFSLSVSDVNESAVGAISDSDGSANTVAEDASVGDTVGVTALASDADADDTVTYSLSDDAGGLFAIDANTGVVTVAGGLDAETATSHDITVVATSSDGSTSTETLTINVSDVDEFDVGSVTDSDATADTIAENAGAGTATGIVATASDGDVDDTVSYSVDDARFEIDASGNVTVASGASFDAETEGSIDITVTATSSDGSTSQQTFSLSVSDVNESAVGAISDSDGSANTVAEDASVGDTVGVTALAADADATDTVTYSLSDDAGGLFAIDANTGVVTVAGGLDAETATSHDITVVATSSDGSTSTETLTINVSDVDEFDVGSVTDSDATADTIAENAGAGTATGIVATASDGDVDDTVSYSVDDARFEIDASGNVTVASGASFDAETEGSIDITVTATSSDGSTSQQTFSLNVSDVDEFDVGSISDSDGSANTVAENASVGDTVGVTASATDADADDSVTYSLSDDAGGLFAIDANTGVVTVAGGLDAETATSHDITVVATSSDGSTSTETLTINVSDVDEFDVGSITDSDATADTIAENATAGTATGIVASASDADVDDTVSYSVDDARFEIDASGNVTVASGASFDAETEGSIDITVTATSSDGSTSQQTFSLDVSDVDEFDVGAISDSDGSANTVAEDASVGDTVGVTALAADADATDTVTYSLSDDAGGLFAIDANTGVVTVAGGLDAETATSHDITVVATSTDGSTSTETLTINVSDVDEFDVGSVTDGDATADTIAENAGAGTATGIVATASDGDVDDTVSYSVDDARFEIDASGNVTVASGASFDAETEGSIDITVTATSSDGSTSQQTFSLNVSDVDEFDVGSISDSDGSANTVAENASVGDTVGVTASATDADADDSVTYSLSDDAGGLFAIDANTGVVTVAGGLDAETATSHDITVVATSSDGSTSTETLTINVSDVDEFDVGSVTDSDATADTIAENAGAGTATGIVATASDGDVDDTVSYSVDDARFEIDASGNVTVASGASFDAETEGSIDITVTATSSDGSTSQQTFSLSVSDVNESAVGAISDSDGSANTVAEDASVGDTVGVTALASDADADDTVTYSLSDDAGGLFAIDANTGVVTVAGGLDAETATSHDITIVATSSDGSTSTETLTINVSDVDEFDVGSITDSDATADTIAENAGAGTATGIVATASDGDVDDTVSYSVDDARFEIDASGNVTVASGASFDAETEGSIDITVTATSSDGSTSQQTFSLSVSDVNESAVGAISDSDGSANTVAEDASVGDTVGVTALAADADATDTVTYSLSDDAGGLFAIDANTGVVTVAGGLDAETATSHDITVVATSSDGSTSTETLTINVSDVDEFDVGSVTDSDATADTIAENAGAGTATGIVATASDGDVDDTVSYSVDDARFEIDASGNVTVASGASFDAETEGSIDITVTATSSDGSTSQQTFSLNVSDVDEFDVGSISDSDGSANTVAENASVGDTVGVTASATDADADDSVTYSLSDDAGGLFAIDANTGVVTVAGGLDAETATSHDITVVATSSDGSTSTETLTINVSDVDEFDVGSVTDSDATADTIAENAGAGTATGIVATASDGDVDDTVSYSVDDARFEIDASGNVTVASGASFDAETEGSIDITVTATSSDGSTSQQTFSLDVSDVDEFDVGAISDSDGSSNTVAEDASVGDTVGVTALAADADATDTVTYSLSDDAGGLFAIDANTGVVTVAGGLDAETATSHDITILATSSDGSTSTETLTINVSDVDEFDVGSVTDGDATADTIAENAGAGTATGIVATASDGDVDDTVSYSVDDARFEIDASGNVTVASGASFDAETEGSIDITVIATSSDGSTSQQTFSLNVSDVDEFDVGSISDSDGSSNTVAEDASVGDTVGVTALAADADATDTVTYSLSDDAGGLFAIDANTGVVTVAGGLDAETATSHDITILATSSDGSTSTETLTVNVSDVDEFDVGSVTDSDATADTIAENAGAGTATGIVATASDGDVDDTVSYSVDDARFEIDASGNVTVASGASFDAETEGSIDITVTATSSDGSTSQQTFSLSVSDVDEFDVGSISDSDGSSNTVAEDASVGDTVGVTALASDADTTDTVTYSLSDDAGGLFAIDANTGVVTVAGGLDAETATSHDITILATSSDGSTSTETLTVNVSDVDEFDVGSVTDSDATADTIAENATAGTATGIVASASDGDVTDSVTYSVNDARFEIDASGNVTVASGASFDAETEGSIDITVTATSSDGSTSQQTFSLSVSDVDEFDVGAISDSDGASNTVAENAMVGDTVGVTALASDTDATDTVTYSLSDDAGGMFAIDANTGVVTVAGSLDYETAASHDIAVVATSSDGSTSTATLTINVSDVNEAPTDIKIAAAGDDPVAGGSAGTLAAVDEDSGETFTYSLTDDAGGMLSINASTGELTWNGTASSTPEFTEQTGTANPFDGFDVGSDSTATFADIDGDGDLDMFMGANDGKIYYSENTGSATSPNYSTPVENTFGFTDVGTDSTPTFADIDGDGDLDAFVGREDGTVDYYENTGSATNPVFATAVNNPFGLTDVGTDSAPTFVDIDGDGDLDAFVGEDSGVMNFFENTGTASSPTFAAAVTNPMGLTDIGTDADAIFADMDGDGDYDVLIGASDGTLNYFENTGTSTNASFTASGSNPFGITDVGTDSSPTLADIDGDGDLDLIIGEGTDAEENTTTGGNFNYFENTAGPTVDTSVVQSYDLTVEVTDSGGNSYSEDITITTGTDGTDTITGTSHDDIIYGMGNGTSSLGSTDYITNGSFESGSTGWTLTSGPGFQIKTSGQDGVASSDGSNYLDTDHSPGNISFEQTVSGLTGGSDYQLSFEAADFGHDNLLEVYFGGQLVGTIDTSGSTMQTYDITVTAGSGDGTDVLSFVETGAVDYGGTAIDNIRMYEITDNVDVIDGGAGDDLILGDSTSTTISDVAITNSSFETAALSDGGTTGTVSGWTDVNGYGEIGVLDPTTSQFTTVPSGENVLYVPEDNLVSQTLGETFDSGADYQLTFSVGNAVSSGSGDSWAVRVYAGGTLIGSSSGTEPGADSWQDVTIDIDGDAYAAADGGTLKIEIENTSSYTGSGDKISFDDFQMTKTTGATGGDDSLIGGDGDDTLIGGGGADTLDGGADNDLLDGGVSSSSEAVDPAQAILDLDPIGYWRLGETSGSTATDETGNQDGTYSGVDYSVTSANSNDSDTAVDLDGSTDYISISHNSSYSTTEGTVQLWFNADTTSGDRTLISKVGGGEELNIRIYDGTLYAKLGDQVVGVNVGTDEWHHVSFSWGPSGLELYLDGAEIGSMASSKTLSGNTGDIYIGRYGGGGKEFDGTIDEVVFFDKQLSEVEISNLYDSGLNGIEGGSSEGDADSLSGGDGDDTLIGGGGADTLDGGTGTDTADYSSATEGVALSLSDTDGSGLGGEYANTAAGGYAGDAAGDTFTSIENVVATGFDDTIGGGDSAMSFDLGAGNDMFDTDATLAVADTVSGGAGADTIYGGDGADSLDGGTGNDSIHGEAGNDSITGGAGTDFLSGGDGDDTLAGGADNDTLYGGDGDDMFTFAEGDGADTAYGGVGASWVDTLELMDATGGGDIGVLGTDWTITLDSGSIVSQDANSIDLSDDADGTITLSDGSTINFFELERIEW